MIGIKIEKAKISKNSKQQDIDGLEISYKIDNRKLWDVISLTNEEALELAEKLMRFLGIGIFKEK
jgi:hypothetical protein